VVIFCSAFYYGTEPDWFRNPFLSTWSSMLASGTYMECEAFNGACFTPEPPPGGGDPGGGGGGGGGGDPAGPPDTDTQCGILNIPCNFRALFLPKKNWGEEFEIVTSWGTDRFPFGLVAWFHPCEAAHIGCGGSANAFLTIPEVANFQVGGSTVILGGWTVFAGSTESLDMVPAAIRPISAWWISEPLGGRKLLFYGLVTSFFVGIFVRFTR
jgi:hypothetical protein